MSDLPNIPEDANVPPPTDTHSPQVRARMPNGAIMRRRSTSVDLDFFDPAGVHTLQRTVTDISERHASLGRRPSIAQTDHSDETLTPGDGPFDLEKTLKFVRKRMEQAQITHRELGVVFEDLKVVGLGAAASYQPTLGSTLNPLSMLEQFRTARHPPLRNILEGFSGVVRPGEMILTLSNQTAEFHDVSGSIQYDGFSPAQIYNHYRGDVQYCPEDDVHFPTLTVEQTLQFATRLRAPQAKARLQQSRDEYVESMVEILMTIFGLRHVRSTQVGDNAIRGVSGEALAMRMRLGAWDNSTRGLDASTALEFGRALRIATDFSRLSTIVSIYQASETLYNLFDKVCVLSEGRMAERQTTPDFLVSVTDPVGRIVRPGLTPAEDQARPRTSAELAEHFLKSSLMERNRQDIESYKLECLPGSSERVAEYKKSAQAEHAKGTRRASPYTESIPMQARAVMLRRVQIITGFLTPTIITTATGSVFVNSPESTSAFFSRGGVMFFALLFAALSSMAEIGALFSQRPIILRQSKAALYHPFIDAVALTLVDIPITFATLSVCIFLRYPSCQALIVLDSIFFLFLFTMSLTMKAFFRAIAAGFKSPAPAQSVAGIMILLLVIYTGYTIPKPSMIGALRWITYINPLRYGFEAVVANEFHTLRGSCANLVPQGPGYENVSLNNQVCATVGSVAGQNFVDGNAFIAANEWMNFGIVVAFAVGFIALLLIFTEFNTASSTDTSVVLFKRGSKDAATLVDNAGAGDPEKANEAAAEVATTVVDQEEVKEALAAAPAMKDVFSWQNLNYVVPVKEGTRKLLDNVSGYVVPGKLTALMGESGAGKTTLLNVLAERTTTGVVKGDIFVNGHKPPHDFRSQTGYVQQMDTHVPTDTVREALLFSATLRQPASVPLEEKVAYVETCLKMCGLEAVADASVGSLGIEHRKRTTIGPTSGLDSQSAWAIMLFLKQLAANGQAILCTYMFDRLLLLRKGGQVVYFGDIGQDSKTLIHYFESNGARSCDTAENPAEYMLDVIGAGATAKSDVDWKTTWEGSAEKTRATEEIEKIHIDGRSRGAAQATFASDFATSWMTQAIALFRRDLRFRWRNPTYLLAKFVLNIAAGLLIGFTFFKAKTSQQGTQNQLFVAIFLSTILSAPLSNQLQVPFLDMRKIYEIREGPTKFYSWSALIASGFLSDLPWNILGSSLYFLCWYWTVGFDTSRAGYTYLMLGVIFPLWYTSFGQATAAMAPSAEIAAVLFSFLFSFVTTFNGVLQPYRALGWWQWMYRVSPFTYLIEGLLGQALGKHSITCSPVELLRVNPPSGQTCGEYFSPYIIYYSHHWRNLGLMFVYIGFNIIALFALTWFFRIRTGSIFSIFKGRKSSA
ncbi:Brefeldin A resistance protein [Favolaschia claudopus]|uniref:Brefeldin A resistance protein n=1 Tax=Favolaschia claudopus TaxID=2862362 RepID=A0AAW0C4K2_9AGAR